MQKQTVSNNNLINLPFYTKFQIRLHQNISIFKILDCAKEQQQVKPVKQVYHYHKWLRNDGITSLVDLFLIIKQSIKQVQPEMLEIP